MTFFPSQSPLRVLRVLRGKSFPNQSRGFTLVELIVVIVLLSVVAGLTAPRLFSTSSRRAESNMREVADLLGIAARRDASGTGSAGEAQRLAFDSEKRTLALQVRRSRQNARGEVEAVGTWRNDPLAPVVNLETIKISRAVIDGVAADDRAWTLDFVAGQVRPTVELIVESSAGGAASGSRSRVSSGPRWNILLLPYSTGAEIATLGATQTATSGASAAGGGASALRSIDLDASGMGDRPW